MDSLKATIIMVLEILFIFPSQKINSVSQRMMLQGLNLINMIPGKSVNFSLIYQSVHIKKLFYYTKLFKLEFYIKSILVKNNLFYPEREIAYQ